MTRKLCLRCAGFVAVSLAFMTALVVGTPALAQTGEAKPVDEAKPVTEAPNPDKATNEPSAPVALQIGGGDLLDVTVYGVPELTQTARVSNAGDIFLPLVGKIHVAGLNTEEAQAGIREQLIAGGYLVNPQVNVFIKEYATSGISVLGEVTKPGIYPLLGARRLYDALAAAGGLSTRAGDRISITHRDQPDDPVIVTWSKEPGQSKENNIPIVPGDTIVVSRAGVVYVVGEVVRPKGIVMENNEKLTVLQALAIAEGTKPYAALDNAKLIRKTGTGHEEIPLQLKQMLQAKAPDVALEPEDIVFVPASAGRSAAVKSLNAIIQVATGIAIYGRR